MVTLVLVPELLPEAMVMVCLVISGSLVPFDPCKNPINPYPVVGTFCEADLRILRGEWRDGVELGVSENRGP